MDTHLNYELCGGEEFLSMRKDPLKLRSYVDKYVEVIAVDGAKFSGKIYTIDPMSGSIILVRQEETEIVSDLVMGHAVKSIAIIARSDDFPLGVFLPEPKASYSAEEIVRRRIKLKEWLQLNKIPIEEHGELLRLKGAIEIHPPYDKEDCQSLDSNEIILGRMQDLISVLPIISPNSKTKKTELN